MNTLKCVSILWVLYGIAGFWGFQKIPYKFKGYYWTKAYIRDQGITWILLGVPYFIFSVVIPTYFPYLAGRYGIISIFIVVLGVPSLIYSVLIDRKYKALLKKAQDETSI